MNSYEYVDANHNNNASPRMDDYSPVDTPSIEIDTPTQRDYGTGSTVEVENNQLSYPMYPNTLQAQEFSSSESYFGLAPTTHAIHHNNSDQASVQPHLPQAKLSQPQQSQPSSQVPQSPQQQPLTPPVAAHIMPPPSYPLEVAPAVAVVGTRPVRTKKRRTIYDIEEAEDTRRRVRTQPLSSLHSHSTALPSGHSYSHSHAHGQRVGHAGRRMNPVFSRNLAKRPLSNEEEYELMDFTLMKKIEEMNVLKEALSAQIINQESFASKQIQFLESFVFE